MLLVLLVLVLVLVSSVLGVGAGVGVVGVGVGGIGVGGVGGSSFVVVGDGVVSCVLVSVLVMVLSLLVVVVVWMLLCRDWGFYLSLPTASARARQLLLRRLPFLRHPPSVRTAIRLPICKHLPGTRYPCYLCRSPCPHVFFFFFFCSLLRHPATGPLSQTTWSCAWSTTRTWTG